MNLTDTQPQAIAHTKGNLQLIACAGSGKTEVVARFVSNLLNPATEPQVAPANIIAFTFTEKAAAELKERIVTRCREENGNLPGLAELFVGTIHAFCLDLLKTEVARFLKYEVLNEVQQALFVDRHSRKSGLTTATDITGKPLQRYKDTSHYVSALSILREAELNDKVFRGSPLVAGLNDYKALLDEKDYLDYACLLPPGLNYDEFLYQLGTALFGAPADALQPGPARRPLSLLDAFHWARAQDRQKETPMIFDPNGLAGSIYL